MNDENLDHLIPRKDELHRISPWAKVQLRLIRDDLAPFFQRGVPLKHLLTLLEPLEITNRRETLRQFVRDEFPDAYVRYYAKRGTADRFKREHRQQEAVLEPSNGSSAAAGNESQKRDNDQQLKKATEEKTKLERKTKRLDVDTMLSQVGDFASGKQFDE
tara:strand:- start:3474 stop:3953 length:480 start_codon:yes stop_codon:yes gene_type:complete